MMKTEIKTMRLNGAAVTWYMDSTLSYNTFDELTFSLIEPMQTLSS